MIAAAKTLADKQRGQRYRSSLVRLAVVLWLTGGFTLAALAEEQVLFDFETTPLSKRWSAVREIAVARSKIPAPPPAQADKDVVLPSEYAAHVETTGNAGMFSNVGELPTDWRHFRTLNFWVYRDPQVVRERPATTFEVRLYDDENQVAFWRRVSVTHEGWERIAVPLRWMRWGEGRVPRWNDVARLGFWFRDSADLWIDAVTLTPGENDLASTLDAKDLYSIAFPGVSPAKVIVIQTDDYLVMTDAADLDATRLGQHLNEVVDAVRRDLSLQGRPANRAVLLIFATPREFQTFTPRFAQKLGGVAPAPTSDGYTTQGVATSYWDPQFATMRPVFTHEFVHSLVAQWTRIPNGQEWFNEGFATLIQRRFHPQTNLPELVRQGLADPSLRLPLARLCDGKTIPLNAYWQAMTVVELLLTNPKYSPHVPELLEKFVEAGSTDLGPYLNGLLNTDWLQLTNEWITHCQRAYPVEEKEAARQPSPGH